MAKIVPSENAPDAQVHYSLGSASFDLGPGGSYETDDREILSGGVAHPWLDVEFDPEVELGYVTAPAHVRPEDDVLSQQNSVAFDPDQVRADAPDEMVALPTAIDAGLDQSEEVTVGTTAVTIAADDAQPEPEVTVIPSVPQPDTSSSVPTGEVVGEPAVEVTPPADTEENNF